MPHRSTGGTGLLCHASQHPPASSTALPPVRGPPGPRPGPREEPLSSGSLDNPCGSATLVPGTPPRELGSSPVRLLDACLLPDMPVPALTVGTYRYLYRIDRSNGLEPSQAAYSSTVILLHPLTDLSSSSATSSGRSYPDFCISAVPPVRCGSGGPWVPLVRQQPPGVAR